MSYNRQPSPGSRKIQNPGRTSNISTNSSQYDQNSSYTSPRSSTTGVIPISTQTFVNYPPASSQSSRPTERVDNYSGRPVDSYTGRPRRLSQVDTQRGSVSNVSQQASRNRPTVVQNDFARPASPQKSSQNKDYYVTPAVSKEPRKAEHKKVYSVNDGTASLVADVNTPASGERHHKRRESDGGERGARRGGSIEKDRGRRPYHLNGPAPSKPAPKSVEDEDAFSYTDAAGMFRETEPRWREREARPRRGSLDRGGASRERPVSMLVDTAMDPRKSNREIGPPPSTRGWDKVNEIGRSRTTRDRSREVLQSPTGARVPQSPNRARMPSSPNRGPYADSGTYGDPRDQYYVPPRTDGFGDRRNPAPPPDRPDDRYERYDQYDYDDRREPRHHVRRNSMTRVPDHNIQTRGFGIRNESQDRYGRASDESFTQQQNKSRDSGYSAQEPHRRDTAPDITYHDEQRLEQEKRERMQAAERGQREERDRQYDRDSRDKDQRRREDDRAYNREYDRDYDDREREQRRDREREYDHDRERERERERMMQPQYDNDRQHYTQENNRDRDYNRDYNRKENGPRDSGEKVNSPSFPTAAAGALAGAGAAYGLGSAFNKNDDRERDRDHDRERERNRSWEDDRRQDKSRDYERDRLSPRPQQPQQPQQSQQAHQPELHPPPEPRSQETHSDEGSQYQERDRYRGTEREAGLGFAFEQPPEPPRSAPPMRDRPEPAPPARDVVAERDFERTHEDEPPALDPDEDYRRRMAQVQREMGGSSEDRSIDNDPDRERRRRDREQRQRDRHDARNGDGSSTIGTNSTFTDTPSSYNMPGSYENDSVAGTDLTASTGGTLRRKPSILDQPMMDEPVQILDNSMSDKRENRVKIVDPPTEEEDRRPRGILKRPTEKFPDYPDAVREGVAPLKDAKNSSIPPGARWTKIDRRLVNPEALEEAKERFEERLDCVIVLRVLTKEDIQKLADRTRELRDERYEQERDERRAARRREREDDRRDRDEYEDNSEDEFKPRAPKMLEAPSTAGASSGEQPDFNGQSRDRYERDSHYASSGHGRRDDYQER